MGKEPPLPTEKETVWSSDPVWTLWRRKKKIFCSVWNQTIIL